MRVLEPVILTRRNAAVSKDDGPGRWIASRLAPLA